MKINNENDDTALVTAFRAGNKQAFNELVAKYQQKIIKIIKAYVRDKNEACDLAQDTFIKAYQAMHTFRDEAGFYTWLYRIAMNTAKNYLLSQSNRNKTQNCELDAIKTSKIDTIPALQDSATQESRVMNHEMHQMLLQTIQCLSGELRAAFMLREVYYSSYDEIASIMDCPVGTVRSRIARARKEIEQRVQQHIHLQVSAAVPQEYCTETVEKSCRKKSSCR
jgi:RNA polymerase sigma-70 factor (ECF subfamily)